MQNSCRITIGKKIWKNHFFELRSRLQQQDTKSRASKCWFLRKTGGHTWWEWFRIVPGAVLSIESKNGVRISKNKKCNFFAFYQNFEKLSKGGTLGLKKFKVLQSGRNLQDWWDHQKSKLGRDFEVVLHLVGVWATKNEKWCKGGTLGTKKIQSAPIWTKLAGLVGGIKKTSWEVFLQQCCTVGDGKSQKLGRNAAEECQETTKSGGFSSE